MEDPDVETLIRIKLLSSKQLKAIAYPTEGRETIYQIFLIDQEIMPVCDSYYLTTLVDPDDLQNEYITWMHIRFPGVEPPSLQIFEGELL
jgi:hypothetical protein